MEEHKLIDIHPAPASILLRELRSWGISIAEVARRLGVSRQFAWQVLHLRIPASEHTLAQLTRAARECIAQRCLSSTYGSRMRRARINAGLTLKQAASMIGYSWVAVERWEMDICLPKPGVLWHLRHLYGVNEDWVHDQPNVHQLKESTVSNLPAPDRRRAPATRVALRA